MKKFITALFASLLASLLASCQPALAATIINSLPYNLTNGSLADATQVMGNFNQIVSNANTNAAHNGANTDITSLSGLTTPLAPTYGGTPWFIGGTSTGSANAQVVSVVTPSSFTLATGNTVWFIAGYTNTGAATLNVNGTGATNLYKNTQSGVAALAGGELIVGNSYQAAYDGTELLLINPSTALLAENNLADVASASTAINNILPSQSGNSGKFLTTNGTSASWSAAGQVRSVHSQFFSGAGTYTYTPTTGMVYTVAICVGSGGGGGGSKNTSSHTAAAGGAAGEFREGVLTATAVGASQTITIGAAGTAGANTGGTGGNGGNTSLGSLIVCEGGNGGAGNGGTNSGTDIAGTAGGTGGSSGDYAVPGGNGAPGTASGSSTLSGAGGDSALGRGGLALQSLNGASTTAGNAATGYGAGGGGAIANGGGAAGGVGTAGAAYFIEFCSQ